MDLLRVSGDRNPNRSLRPGSESSWFRHYRLKMKRSQSRNEQQMRDKRPIRRVVREENRVEPFLRRDGCYVFPIRRRRLWARLIIKLHSKSLHQCLQHHAPLLQFTPMFGSSCEFFVMPALI